MRSWECRASRLHCLLFISGDVRCSLVDWTLSLSVLMLQPVDLALVGVVSQETELWGADLTSDLLHHQCTSQVSVVFGSCKFNCFYYCWTNLTTSLLQDFGGKNVSAHFCFVEGLQRSQYFNLQMYLFYWMYIYWIINKPKAIFS